MNKNILLSVFAAIFLTACTYELNLTHDVRRIYENKLEKHLICTQETDIGYKDVSVLPCDTASIHFIKHTSIETYPGTLGNLHHIEFLKECIFILDDTCSYCLNYKEELSDNDKLFLDKVKQTQTEYNYLYTHNIDTLTIDSTLLQIFKKDYGMLEQFKEYYQMRKE